MPHNTETDEDMLTYIKFECKMVPILLHKDLHYYTRLKVSQVLHMAISKKFASKSKISEANRTSHIKLTSRPCTSKYFTGVCVLEQSKKNNNFPLFFVRPR